MSRLTYPRTSPYSATAQTSWYLGNYVDRPIPPDSGDQLYVLLPRHQYNPTLLSQELYGSPVYWWIFMQRNIDLIRDPIWDFVAGMTIVVPSAGYLKTVIG